MYLDRSQSLFYFVPPFLFRTTVKLARLHVSLPPITTIKFFHLLDSRRRLKLMRCRLQRSLGRGAGKLELCWAPLSIELSKEALDSLDYIER